MTEKKMYEKMKAKFPNVFLQRIESGRTGLGIPDIAYTVSEKKSGWIESKVVKRFPKTGVVKVPFRPGQYSWITRYCCFSQKVFLFLWVQDKLYVMKGDEIFVSYTPYSIQNASCYDGLWNRVDWVKILSLL